MDKFGQWHLKIDGYFKRKKGIILIIGLFVGAIRVVSGYSVTGGSVDTAYKSVIADRFYLPLLKVSIPAKVVISLSTQVGVFQSSLIKGAMTPIEITSIINSTNPFVMSD